MSKDCYQQFAALKHGCDLWKHYTADHRDVEERAGLTENPLMRAEVQLLVAQIWIAVAVIQSR